MGENPNPHLERALRGDNEQDPKPFNSPSNPNQCDGCGKVFDYPIHDHFGYRSCSVGCDDILSDYIISMQNNQT